jgi:hypothetical protein
VRVDLPAGEHTAVHASQAASTTAQAVEHFGGIVFVTRLLGSDKLPNHHVRVTPLEPIETRRDLRLSVPTDQVPTRRADGSTELCMTPATRASNTTDQCIT